MPLFPKEHQQWETVFIGPKKSANSRTSDAAAVRQTLQRGGAVETVEKNRAMEASQKNRALDNDTETLSHETVTHDFRVALQRARQAKKMSQKELAFALQEKPAVVNDYESGRAIPNNQLISKMERALGAKLPRKKR